MAKSQNKREISELFKNLGFLAEINYLALKGRILRVGGNKLAVQQSGDGVRGRGGGRGAAGRRAADLLVLGVDVIVLECLCALFTKEIFCKIFFIPNINLFVLKEAVVVIVVKRVIVVVKLYQSRRGWLLGLVPPSV